MHYIYIYLYILIYNYNIFIEISFTCSLYNLCCLCTDITLGGISATCKSNGSDSLTVAVSYGNGCRRETVVEANGTACSSVTKSPRMAVFQCGSLRPNTSYNITAVDSDGHVFSLSCSTSSNKENRSERNCLEIAIIYY